MQYIYNYIHKHGEKFNLMDAGYYAIESLRIEKGYRAWVQKKILLFNSFKILFSIQKKISFIL